VSREAQPAVETTDEREARIQRAVGLLQGGQIEPGPRKRGDRPRETVRCCECDERMQVPSDDGRCGFCKRGI
jgi:hypothetical protein